MCGVLQYNGYLHLGSWELLDDCSLVCDLKEIQSDALCIWIFPEGKFNRL